MDRYGSKDRATGKLKLPFRNLDSLRKRKKDSTKVTRVVGLVKSCSPALSRPLHFSFLSLFQINLVSVISPAVGAALASLKTERYGRTAWEVH